MKSTEQALLAFAAVELVKKAESVPENVARLINKYQAYPLADNLQEQGIAGGVAGGLIGGLGGLALGPSGGATAEEEASNKRKRLAIALLAGLTGAGLGAYGAGYRASVLNQRLGHARQTAMSAISQ